MLRNLKFDADGNSLCDQVFQRSGLLSIMVTSRLPWEPLQLQSESENGERPKYTRVLKS